MDQQIGSSVLSDIQRAFSEQRKAAERAIAQLSDADVFHALGAEDNSVAIIMKHVGGNLRSRWTDFLTSDGEKPDRNRDGEFEIADESRARIEEIWRVGFATLENTLATLAPADLTRTVRIRGEPLTVVHALHRSLAHTAQHVGQIILLAKHMKGADWQTLSIPKARSADI